MGRLGEQEDWEGRRTERAGGLGGQEGKRVRRSGGLGGKDEWEGRRGVWEGRRGGRAGGVGWEGRRGGLGRQEGWEEGRSGGKAGGREEIVVEEWAGGRQWLGVQITCQNLRTVPISGL